MSVDSQRLCAVTAEQIRAYRAVVHAYVELLVAFRSNVPCMIAIRACYRRFGVTENDGSERAWHVRNRISDSYRRTAERIARQRGWIGESYFSEDPTPMPDGQLVMNLNELADPKAA